MIMSLRVRMAGYMTASIVFVSSGGFLLWYYGLVPVALTYATFAAVLAVAIDAIFVLRGSRLALNFGLILSLAAIISSAASPAHLSAMLRILDGGIITVLDVLEILGFYLFPLLYLGTRFAISRKRIDESFH